MFDNVVLEVEKDMDEFRKPYEYEEEKIPGYLKIFAIFLISFDLFITLGIVYQGYGAANRILNAEAIYLGISLAYVLFLIFTAVVDLRGKRSLILVSKLFLVTRIVFTVASLIMICIMNMNDPDMIGPGSGQFETLSELILIIFAFPAAYMVVFSLGWYLYFNKSKKCADLARGISHDSIK